MGTSFITRKSKMRIKQCFMLFMVFLVTFGGMMPSFTPVVANELELPTLVEPEVSKDVEGESSKELIKGEDFNYNVNIVLPNDLSGYESMEISDDLDERLTVQETSILINGDEDDTFDVTEEDQTVSVELTSDQLEELVGKEIKLQIVSQVKEDVTEGENIENIAQVIINNNVMLETNSTFVTVVDTEETIEKPEVDEETDAEQVKDQADEIKVENEKPKEVVEEGNMSENEKNTSKKPKEKTKEANRTRVDLNNTINAFKSISQNPKTTMLSNPGEGSYIDYDYSFTPKMTSETELTVTPGANTNYQMDNNLVKFKPQSGTTVNGELYYTNVGVYNDEIIDAKIEISAVNVANGLDASLSNYVARGTTHPGPIVTRKMTFISQKTGQPIELAGYVSFRGITGAKYLEWNTPIKDIFAIDDSQIIYEDTPNGIRFFSTAPGGSLENDTMMTLVFEPTSTIETVFDGPFSTVHGAGFEQFSLTGIVPPGPSKNGSIIEDKEISENEYPSSREKIYEIFQNVPYQTETSYYSSFEITDELDPVLKVAEEDISVQNTLGEDVTNLFDISVDNHRLIVEAKSNTLTNESFYNQLYTITINGSLDLNSNYEKYIDEDDYVAVPNTVTTTVDGDSKESNEALAKFKFEELELPEPPNACVAPVSLINGSFEEPPYSPDDSRLYKHLGWFDAPQDTVPGWKTTDSSGLMEIMNKELGEEIPPGSPYAPLKVTPAHGDQFVELNSREFAQLYQDVDTTPGQTIYWRLAHHGRNGPDTMALKIDSAEVEPKNLQTVQEMTSDNREWKYYSGSYVVPSGQTKTRFGFEAVESYGGNVAAGNFLDDIFLGTEPCVDTEKSVSPEGEVYAGDELTYEVTVKNSGGDVAADMVIEDEIPEGTEYVPGSMKILNGPKSGDLTDEDDEDAGHYADGKVTFNIGDLPNTTNMPEGVTVQFKVITLNEHAGKVVVNEANVKHKNLLTDEDHETPTNETETPVEYKDPELDSKKSAELEEKAVGNMDEDNPEVGDTLRYTITTSNVIEGSLVENLAIRDTIPEGLTYVDGSLEVDGVSVTDEEDDDAGHVINGNVIGNFGDITDTDEHVVTFLVTVDEGQAGNDIENIAEVKGDNTDVDEPEEEVKVYPRDPVLEAEKSAVNAKADKEKFEVGDTIIYAIQTRNIVSDSLVEDLVIVDELPEGLVFVDDSLEVSHNGEAEFTDGKITASFGDVEDTEWRTVTFEAVIESGQSGKEIENTAQITSNNTEDPEDPTTKIIVDPKDPQLDSAKSSSIEEKAEGNTDVDNPEVGDTLRYTIITQNTIEDSLVENLVITDIIPEGLTYVEGSLEVDGVAVTDAEEDDAGHVIDGNVTGKFGDVTDTDEHTVTFLVTVDEGQAGKDIKNIAEVKGDNTDTDEPEEEVKVYPREPVLEAEKSAVNADAEKEKFEVGDTVVYTIQSRNTVSDSLVQNLVITDELPSGLEYIEGSLEVSHDGEGAFADGTITANFGDVADTKWRTVTFEAIIESGQSGEEIENTAEVTSDDTDEPEEPTTTITVDPKDPELESSKSSSLEEKAEGNTDVDNPEVGDTLRYTIITQNIIEDSLVENLVITDVIPEGLTYVSGSLEVDSESVTDAEGDDAGHVVEGEVAGSFGDITDTEEHMITFLVIVDEGQAGEDINNIAEVKGDNTDTDEPEEEVKVYPREPVLESEKSAQNLEEGKDKFEVGDTVIYTIQTRNTVSDSLVQNLTIIDELPEGLEFIEGSIEVSHNGEGAFQDGVITADFGDVADTEWHTVTFEAIIESGQSGQKIENTAQVTSDDTDDPEEPTTTITVDPKDPQLDSAKSSSIEEKAEGNTDVDNPEVGDTLRYTISTRNTIEDSLVENLVIADEIPDGLTYVEGSLEVDGVSVTDGKEDDAGHVVEGTITGTFGDITDTDEHTVSFLVTVDEGQAGKAIHNIAEVKGDNTDVDEPEEKIEIYPRHPVLEAEKSAINAEAGKEKFEVGDTIIYTIQTRNIVSDSLVENLVITDELPEGLAFVEGSLEVSHNGEAEFADGTITASFGDVEDTEWRAVTFEAVIESGQSGKEIENTATAKGKEVPPIHPRSKTKIDPKDPKLSSEKSVVIEEKAEGNTSAENVEVGDTLRYTITTQNTVEDSLVENLVITDELPEGVTFVEDSVEASHDGDATYENGVIKAAYGDVTDTDVRSVTFLVTVDEGQAGKNIKNIAEVKGDNTDIDEPEEETEIHPRHPVLEAKKSAVNAEADKEKFEVGDTIIYTIQTRNTVFDSLVRNVVIADELPEGLVFVDGSIKVSHDGEAEFTDGTITASFGDVEDTEWRTVTFEAVIESGQSGKEIRNTAQVTSDDTENPEEPTTTITVDPKDPQLDSAKSSSIEEKAEGNTDVDNPEVGDTLRYTISMRNTIEDSLVENLVIADTIPKGLTYVEGSLKVDGVSVTDAEDDDVGHVVDGTIIGNFGDIRDADRHTVTFLVTVDEGQAGKDIINIAEVKGDNTDIDEPEEEVKIYPRNPVLESVKSAKNLEKGKETFEAGDTIVYTIKARNTVSDSLVENLIITDKLPEGIEYVKGSLEVSHEGVGEYSDGTITAAFGDVTDQEWYTITFHATIKSDQSGETIKNVATVNSDNITESEQPEAKILVEEKDSVTPTPEKTDPPAAVETDEGNKLPKTATNTFNFLLLGIIAVLVGLVTLRIRKTSER